MKQKSSTEAILAMMQDAQQFKRVCNWRKAAVEVYSDYIDAEYQQRKTLNLNYRISSNLSREKRYHERRNS